MDIQKINKIIDKTLEDLGAQITELFILDEDSNRYFNKNPYSDNEISYALREFLYQYKRMHKVVDYEILKITSTPDLLEIKSNIKVVLDETSFCNTIFSMKQSFQ